MMKHLREFVFANCACQGRGWREEAVECRDPLLNAFEDSAWMRVTCEQPACVALRNLAPPALEAMDAAAECSARPAAHSAIAKGRLILQLAIGPNLWTTVTLAEEAEGALLDALLGRAIQRRKGNTT